MKTEENKPMTIEFFHDVLCAWCFAFSPRLEKLEQQFPEQVSIVHRAFALAPSTDGIERIFGSKEQGKIEIIEHWQQANLNFDTLKICAKEIGLDVEQWEKDYSSEKVKQTLNEDFQQAHMYGVNAVTTIVANGKHKLSGAQPYAVLDEWFRKLI